MRLEAQKYLYDIRQAADLLAEFTAEVGLRNCQRGTFLNGIGYFTNPLR